jgi:hypothetical protein
LGETVGNTPGGLLKEHEPERRPEVLTVWCGHAIASRSTLSCGPDSNRARRVRRLAASERKCLANFDWRRRRGRADTASG